MPASDLAELIARLEAATVPSVELDGRIWCELNGQQYMPDYFYEVSGQLCSHTTNAPQYTGSIDAALTLVPEGWLWRLLSDFPAGDIYVATLTDPDGIARGECSAPTPALTMCIAALKARSASDVSSRKPDSGTNQ